MEKRAFTRQVLHHLGHLSSPHQNPIPCLIKDFCKTGLFIAFEDAHPEQHQALSIDDALFVDFKSSGALQLNYRLHTRVARLLDGAIGLEITHNNPEAVHALYKLAKEPTTAKRVTSQHDFTEVQEKCSQLINSFIASRDKALFNAINDNLMEKAQHSADNKTETTFIDNASRFQKFHERISRGFQNSFLQQVENWLGGKTVSLPEAAPVEKPTSLSLVGKNDFEDWLLVKVLINKADQHYGETLYDLQLRMTELTGIEVNHKNNPLSPAYISHAFYRAITPLALDRDIMQVVLHAFEAQIVVKGLKQLYDTLNELLIKNNVLPVITYQATKSEQPVQANVASENADNPGQTAADISPTEGLGSASNPISGSPVATNSAPASSSSTRTLSAVQNLISLQQQQNSGQFTNDNEQESTPQQLIATDQLLSQLTQLQVAQQPEVSSTAPQPLGERLMQCIGDNQTLNTRDNTAVEVTEKFFGSMDNNKHLSDTIKPVFKQLEIPLLKVFIQDESFFENANHPARQVLNRLAKIGYQGGQLTPKNAQLVEQAIEKINQDFDQDTSIFSTAAAELDEIITQQERVTQRNTERLVKSCDGLETIEKAKYSVRKFIEQQVSDRQVPKVLMLLINVGWRELLAFTLLRDGQDSAIWKSYANVVKSLSLISQEADLANLLLQGTGLLKIINIGINEAPGSQAQMKKLLPMLDDLLCPAENSPMPEFVNANELLETSDDAFSYIDDEEIQSKALSRWIRRARNLKLESWVEYGEGDDVVQMRLAWIGQDHHKFVFVNHQGMKVVESSLREMAEHLQSGHAKLIDDPDQPFVDKNLDAMVQDMYEQMNHQATHDELTGLINRKAFERELAHTLTDAKRHQAQHALCHMDLDQFKVINNACGHEAADKLLQQISELLKIYIQRPNVVARTAGDEFLFTLRNYDIQSAKNFAMEIKNAVSEHRFVWKNKTYTVGASIGIVAIDQASENISSLINAADSARFSAKEAGGNHVHIYQHNDKDRAIRSEVMENMARLNKALDENRLKLRCQKIDPAQPDSTEKPHYEILLSVEDELGIHLAPGEFIHAAEHFNRMQTIDYWVIHKVFTWAAQHKDEMDLIDCLTINLSGHSLNDEALMENILDELLETEIPRNKICFEVTETAAVKNLTDAVEVISELKGLGFKFALDDFGTGLSSYTYLKKLPVDYLKIDGAFVKDIADSADELAMVQSINEMAHLMGKKTIAEYVESQAIKEKLVEMGIDYLQGFHIEKPIPLDTLFDVTRTPSLTR